MSKVIFSGEVGRLEGMYTHIASEDAHIAVVLHPNPLQGGTMSNKVVKVAHKALVDAGCSVLRFNFRGVGVSEGTYSNGIGELADTMVALDWLHRMNPGNRKVWVVGYSFGALVGMQLLMRRPDVGGFIAICPPANTNDFSFLAPCPTSGMIINGEEDTVCPVEHVGQLVNKLNAQKCVSIQYEVIPGCNHTFDNKTQILRQLIYDYVSVHREYTPIDFVI